MQKNIYTWNLDKFWKPNIPKIYIQKSSSCVILRLNTVVGDKGTKEQNVRTTK